MSISNGVHIWTDISAQNAYDSLSESSSIIAHRRLRFSAEKRINSVLDKLQLFLIVL